MNEPSTRQYADGRLRRWTEEHRVQPWPIPDSGGAAATALHEAYSAELEREGSRAMTLNAFTKGLVELGFEPQKSKNANVYPGLSEATRQERAEYDVLTYHLPPRPDRGSLIQEAQVRHMSEVPHSHLIEVPNPDYPEQSDDPTTTDVEYIRCDPREPEHRLPDEVYEAEQEADRAYLAACREDGTIAWLIARHYGPFLDGTPNAGAIVKARDLVERIDDLAAEHNALLARLPGARYAEALATEAWQEAWDARPFYLMSYNGGLHGGEPVYTQRHTPETDRLGDAKHARRKEREDIEADLTRVEREYATVQARLVAINAVLDQRS